MEFNKFLKTRKIPLTLVPNELWFQIGATYILVARNFLTPVNAKMANN